MKRRRRDLSCQDSSLLGEISVEPLKVSFKEKLQKRPKRKNSEGDVCLRNHSGQVWGSENPSVEQWHRREQCHENLM